MIYHTRFYDANPVGLLDVETDQPRKIYLLPARGRTFQRKSQTYCTLAAARQESVAYTKGIHSTELIACVHQRLT
jgi:hypothetical protein